MKTIKPQVEKESIFSMGKSGRGYNKGYIGYIMLGVIITILVNDSTLNITGILRTAATLASWVPLLIKISKEAE